MKNLVIGSSSQLARYFPEDFVKVSSRNLDIDELSSHRWESVFVCFAEQRTYMANSSEEAIRNLFWDTNMDLVKSVIFRLQSVSDKIIYYSTAELWNKNVGAISLNTPFSFHSNHYTNSKYAITQELQNKQKYPKVTIAYPFNFNSIHRGDQYLFGKVFKSILTGEKIVIGDTDYYRELLHPEMVVNASINNTEQGKDLVIGSGRLVHIGDFIKRLYQFFGMKFDIMVKQEYDYPPIYRSHIFYSSTHVPEYGEEKLFNTITKELSELKGRIP